MGIEPTWLAWKARALPLSYTRDNLVGAAGFEPATPCSQDRCATKLRYAPNRKINYIKFQQYCQANIAILLKFYFRAA